MRILDRLGDSCGIYVEPFTARAGEVLLQFNGDGNSELLEADEVRELIDELRTLIGDK